MCAFAADPNYESPADADTNNVYVVTVLIDDGVANDANGATTLTITVADVNDITPVYQAADADDAISVNENVGTTTLVLVHQLQTLIQLVHTVVLLVALMQQTLYSISGSTVSVRLSHLPTDYDNPADADTNNIYVVTVLIDDGANDDANGATLAITVADLNDQNQLTLHRY